MDIGALALSLTAFLVAIIIHSPQNHDQLLATPMSHDYTHNFNLGVARYVGGLIYSLVYISFQGGLQLLPLQLQQPGTPSFT